MSARNSLNGVSWRVSWFGKAVSFLFNSLPVEGVKEEVSAVSEEMVSDEVPSGRLTSGA
jgi:hypothetical protein